MEISGREGVTVETKVERNREMFEASLRGESVAKIAEKYGTSYSSVKNILEKEQKKEELKGERYYQILTTLTDSPELVMRTVHVLERSGLNSKEAILSVTRNDLLRCRNCGVTIASLILKIADTLRGETA